MMISRIYPVHLWGALTTTILIPLFAMCSNPRLALPTPAQIAWQDCEVGLLFDFELAPAAGDFTPNNASRKRFDPNLYQPDKLNTDEWAKLCTASGAKYAVFTATHFNGFMQWQSDAYPYGLKQTSWRGGKGDVVADFVASCRKVDVKPGIFFSVHRNVYQEVWGHYVNWGKGNGTPEQATYNRIAEKQMEEICSKYGPLVQIWFDAGAKTPGQGGADLLPIFEKYQSNSVFYSSGDRSDHRWVGNEEGHAGSPCYATMPGKASSDGLIGHANRSWGRYLHGGDPDGTVWSPAMVDIPLRGKGGHNWFYKPGQDHIVYTPHDLMRIYDTSVGRNANFIIGVVIKPDGSIPEADVKALTEFGKLLKARFANPVAQLKDAEGDMVALALAKPQEINTVILQEQIQFGERVRDHVVEGYVDGSWVTLAQGKVIGHKWIYRFAPQTVSAVRLRVTASLAEPKIRSFSCFLSNDGRTPPKMPPVSQASTAGQSPKPNILVILSDDQGYADAGFQGSTEIPTPHLDRLAQSGLRCTSGYVTHSYCSPSRAGLMTGRYQMRFGHELNPNFLPNDVRQGLPLTEKLLPAHLQTAGYTTGWIGKWHLGEATPLRPENRGFAETFGFLGGGHQYLNWKPNPKSEYALPIERNGKPVEVKEHLTLAFGHEAADFVTRHRAEPWFLYLAFNAPHRPHQPTPERLAQFAHIKSPSRRAYAAQVSLMDDAIGETLAALRQTGQEEKTLIFFLSDNGGHLLNESSNAPLRGSKGTLYEGGVRVPFLVSWPGRLPAGKEYGGMVSSLDIFPTALAVAGVSLPTDKPYDGVNLIPFLSNTSQGSPHDRLFWRQPRPEGSYKGGGWSVRDKDLKLICQRSEPEQLYNLAKDLGESENLASTQPEVRQKLNALMADWDKLGVPLAFRGDGKPDDGFHPGQEPAPQNASSDKERRARRTEGPAIKVLSFNILQGGNSCSEIGATSPLYRKPRHADIAGVILESGADIVGVNEPAGQTDLILPLLKAKDPKWERRGPLYARFAIEPSQGQPNDLSSSRVLVASNRAVTVHVAHWWPAKGYGPDCVQKRIHAGDLPSSPQEFEKQILSQISIPGAYQATLNKIQPSLKAGEPVIVLGDFNEPSHLDWTDAYSEKGADRWVGNPTQTPLRQKIAWAGSKTLAEAGLKDAYREIFPDPVANPGNTWTPPYADNTPGRRPYHNTTAPGQILVRIDWILYAGTGIKAVDAAVVGENPRRPEHGGHSELIPEIQYSGPWPSDHRAVLAVFRIND